METPNTDQPERTGWGSDRHTYTLDQLEYLDECFNLNHGVISKVIGCALGNRELFSHIKTAHDVEFLVGLIENRKRKMDTIRSHYAYATMMSDGDTEHKP